MLSDMTLNAAILTTQLPFIGFVLIMVYLRQNRRASGALSIGTAAVSFVGAAYLLASHWGIREPLLYSGHWLVAGDLEVPFGFLLDPVSLLMLAMVAAISFLVQIYSLGYMAGDPGFSRYFAFQSLFAWAMLTLCVSSSMLQLYVFWELVGLCSYLLIGFWYERFRATQAGKKAFVMTRLGDVALLVGLIMVFAHLGNVNIPTMNDPGLSERMPSSVITLAALLIFGGIAGKSAQFPLLTWLPDAMEGPTPVSALLHSATMVAAGVYLFARLFPFFSYPSDAMTVFLTIGTISMLLGATMAMVNPDIKKVWAYSTISQLGFMIMGLAAGGFFAGSFHLAAHAGFKALLFLCSGVWVHLYGTNDIFHISRNRGRRFMVPMICIVVAAAALAGVPPLSGFFSKEAIMTALAGRGFIWMLAGLVGIFLTSYYAFRVIWILLFPEGTPDEGNREHHGKPNGAMAWPLIILTGVTVVLGFCAGALENFLVGPSISKAHTGDHRWMLFATMGLTLFGVALAWFEFGRPGCARIGFVERIPFLKSLFAERWYLDHFYLRLVRWVVDGFLAKIAAFNEKVVIDENIDRFCAFTVQSGRVLSFLQSGLLRYNLFLMFGVLALVVIAYFLFG